MQIDAAGSGFGGFQGASSNGNIGGKNVLCLTESILKGTTLKYTKNFKITFL